MSSNKGDTLPPHHNLMKNPVGYGILPAGSVQHQYSSSSPLDDVVPISIQQEIPYYPGSAAASSSPAADRDEQLLLPRDFISRRYLAFHPHAPSKQQSHPSDSESFSASNSSYPWQGVSDLERLLVSCCYRDDSNNESNDGGGGGEHQASSRQPSSSSADHVVRIDGALNLDLVLRFVTVLAQHCHDLASRALALAILERSLEQDELDDEADDDDDDTALVADPLLGTTPGSSVSNNDDAGDCDAAPAAGAFKDDDGVSSNEPPAKRQKLQKSIGEGEAPMTHVHKESGLRQRVHYFLAAGGMKILNQWLIEASTPVKKLSAGALASSSAAAAGRPRQQQPAVLQASPTGPILVPLLQFLASVPFDMQLIKKSKINKRIRELSKEMDSLVAAAATGGGGQQGSDSATHAAAGGLPIRQVKKEVDRLKDVWEEKAKKAGNNSKSDRRAPSTNPFEHLQRQLAERLGVLEAHGTEASRVRLDKPDWLTKVEELQKVKEKKRASKSSKLRTATAAASTADLARRERENERAALMREDLQRAQEQRRQLVIRLRELKQKNLQEEQKARHSKNKRSIRWKDSEGPTSRAKKRDLLEEVFLIPGRGSTGDEGNEEGMPLAKDEDVDIEDAIESIDQ
jgi:hypothetical protein